MERVVCGPRDPDEDVFEDRALPTAGQLRHVPGVPLTSHGVVVVPPSRRIVRTVSISSDVRTRRQMIEQSARPC